jgi:peptidoglycan/xylan/chitin deacetylase (PgdA/CDA1 family)
MIAKLIKKINNPLLLVIFFVALSGCGLNNSTTITPAPIKPVAAQPEALQSATAPTQPEAVTILDNLNIPIFVYHNIRTVENNDSANQRLYSVSPTTLEEQFKYLKDNNYTPIRMQDIASYFEANFNLPSKPVVLTFDDGKDSQYIEAWPLLKKYVFTATFFIFTNAIDREGYLTWDQLKELNLAGIEIGDHSRYHPYLTKSTPDELVAEIDTTKQLIENILGNKVVSFAYPFGLTNDDVINQVKLSGFKIARGLHHAQDISKENIFNLGGYIVTDELKYFVNILK